MSVRVASGARARAIGAPRPGWVEWGSLIALAGLPAGALAWLALKGAHDGRSFTGADAGVVVDFMQYVSWIRQAADHALAGNLFGLAPPRHVFLHPGLFLSGLLTRAGLDPVVSYLLWTPVAVLVVWVGALALVSRHLGRRGDRRLALVLALFAASPTAAVMGWAHWPGHGFDWFAAVLIGGEMWAGTQLWGYMFAALAVGLVPLALVAYERGRHGERRMLWAAAAAGGLSAWLQPWQGATVVAVLLVSEGVLLARARARVPVVRARLKALALPVGAALAPLAYYFVLSKVDPSWELAGRVNRVFPPRGSGWVVALTLLPFAPALLAYRLPAPTFGDVALRAWPLAALGLYLVPGITFPTHAFQGAQYPLAVLLVLALRRRVGVGRLPAAVVALALILFVGVGTAHRLWAFQGTVRSETQTWFLAPGERDAMRFLAASPRPGGVVADERLGALVPALTGRGTWVGAVSWTPDYFHRVPAARELTTGVLAPRAARRLVHRSGARWVLTGCRDIDLARVLAPLTGPPRRFGCAALYAVPPRLLLAPEKVLNGPFRAMMGSPCGCSPDTRCSVSRKADGHRAFCRAGLTGTPRCDTGRTMADSDRGVPMDVPWVLAVIATPR